MIDNNKMKKHSQSATVAAENLTMVILSIF